MEWWVDFRHEIIYHFDYLLSGLKEVESEYYEFTEGLDPGVDSIALKEKKDLQDVLKTG